MALGQSCNSIDRTAFIAISISGILQENGKKRSSVYVSLVYSQCVFFGAVVFVDIRSLHIVGWGRHECDGCLTL